MSIDIEKLSSDIKNNPEKLGAVLLADRCLTLIDRVKELEDKMNWISVKDELPKDNWGVNPDFSKEKLIANTACVSLGYYDRQKECWCTGCPAESEGCIDKIWYWAEKPSNPCLIPEPPISLLEDK